MEEVDYCASAEQVRVIPGAPEALARLREGGWLIVIITNQSGIGRGYFGIDAFIETQAELHRQLGGCVDAVWFCPDAPQGGPAPAPDELVAEGVVCRASHARKPDPGMVTHAAGELGIDLARSFFVGDKAVDLQCARAAGVRPVLVRTGYGATEDAGLAKYVANDVGDAVNWILAGGGK